jgi:hypothetical protein
MDNGNIIDIGAGAALFLFTGVETLGIESTILELFSKFGVVAVLWFWLREMKVQMKEQLTAFDKETTEIRSEHREQIERISTMYNEYRDRMEKQVRELTQQINKSNNKDNNPNR